VCIYVCIYVCRYVCRYVCVVRVEAPEVRLLQQQPWQIYGVVAEGHRLMLCILLFGLCRGLIDDGVRQWCPCFSV
jgi:hypothetical protein